MHANHERYGFDPSRVAAPAARRSVSVSASRHGLTVAMRNVLDYGPTFNPFDNSTQRRRARIDGVIVNHDAVVVLADAVDPEMRAIVPRHGSTVNSRALRYEMVGVPSMRSVFRSTLVCADGRDWINRLPCALAEAIVGCRDGSP